MDKISIIVPVYNSSKYLTVLLDSLVSQTYENKEIILVDDGSVDESGEICDDYSKKYNFVKTFHTANGGVQNARNTGIEKASGEYIAFADSDDALDTDCYEILMNALKKNGCDIAACSFRNEFTEDMHIVSEHRQLPDEIVVRGREECLKTIGGRTVDSARYVWNKVFKKELVRDVRFRPGVEICDDLFFTYEAVYNAESMVIVDLPMYHYRYLDSGIVHGASVERCEKCVAGLELLNLWMEEKAPFCKPEIYANYIYRNVKTCEQMLRCFDENVYLRARNNIKKAEEFIPVCTFRISILARAVLKSWKAYAFYGAFFRSVKRMYIQYKRAVSR